MPVDLEQLRAYVEYFRDLGVYEFYRRGEPVPEGEFAQMVARASAPRLPSPAERPGRMPRSGGMNLQAASATASEIMRPPLRPAATVTPMQPVAVERPELEAPIGKLIPLEEVWPVPEQRVPPAARAGALSAVRAEIGDCTRCPLAFAGRRTIVFGEGDPAARLMFVGEGPGADEDASGRPFVGKAGQLLNNMIAAMGLKREEVYIANIVKCRPPANRVPEPVEANTCSPFLAQQIDLVQPEVVVALGSTAAMYVLGVRQALGSLRGRWHAARGAKVAVTYHPAFLLRDPRQKGEAWKDLQRVMTELGLKPAKQVQV